jgi:hypothetical protein
MARGIGSLQPRGDHLSPLQASLGFAAVRLGQAVNPEKRASRRQLGLHPAFSEPHVLVEALHGLRLELRSPGLRGNQEQANGERDSQAKLKSRSNGRLLRATPCHASMPETRAADNARRLEFLSFCNCNKALVLSVSIH